MNNSNSLNNINPNYDALFAKTHQLFPALFSTVWRELKIVIIGLGGVGSWVVEALARSGIEHFYLIDGDIISTSNTNRQLHALHHTFGQSKVFALKTRLLQINSNIKIQTHEDFLSPDQDFDALADFKNQHFILDCCDDLRVKTHLITWLIHLQNQQIQNNIFKPRDYKYICKFLLENINNNLNNLDDVNELKIPSLSIHRLIIAGAAGGKTRIQDLEISKLKHTKQDAMLSKLRANLRKNLGLQNMPAFKIEEILENLCCVYSQQAVQKTKPNIQKNISNIKDVEEFYIPKASLNCAGFGSSMLLTASMGLLMVQALQEKIIDDLNLNFKI